MKKLATIALLLTSTLLAGKAYSKSELMDFKLNLDIDSVSMPLSWTVASRGYLSENGFKGFVEGGEKVVEAINDDTAIKLYAPPNIQRVLIKKYKPQLIELFKNFSFAGKSRAYFNLDKNKFPAEFSTYKGNRALLVNFASGNIYNSYKLDKSERLKNAVSDLLLPATDRLASFADKTGLNYVAYGVSFLHKDFTEKYDSESSEYVCIIFSKDSLKKYTDAETTAQELLDESDIFAVLDNASLRKVNVKL